MELAKLIFIQLSAKMALSTLAWPRMPWLAKNLCLICHRTWMLNAAVMAKHMAQLI